MRIAIICSSFFPVIDGVTIAVYQRLEHLSSLGHQVIVFCPDYSSLKHIYPDYQAYMGAIFPGVEIVNLPSTKAIALDFERDLMLKSDQILFKKLAQFKPDLIHVDEPERLGFCLLKLPGVNYAWQQQIPCVAWFHTNYLDYLDDYFKLPWGINELIKKILGFIFAKIYNAYDSTLVSSPITARKVRQMGIKNITCAELLGCDLSQFNQINKTTSFFAESHNIPGIESKLKLIFIGRLTPDKGWAFALETLVKLPSEIRQQIAIIIAGDGPLRSEIEQTLKQFLPDVYLLGRISPQTVPSLLVNGDLFISNSEKETKGLTVIEAAAAGIPAIAPRAGGVIDTILDGKTGYLYQPQNQTDFLDKLTRLITDPQLRQSMGNQAQEQAQQYSWQYMVNNLVAIWAQEVKNKQKSKINPSFSLKLKSNLNVLQKE